VDGSRNAQRPQAAARSTPLDRDEPVHAFEFAPEPSGVFQIIVFAAIGRENFEDYSDHGHLSFAVEHLGSTIKCYPALFEVRDVSC
jgi:hypothetical protein